MAIMNRMNQFKTMIEGSESYQKAEVTVGGVDTNELSSKTMESKKVPNLYLIGEGWMSPVDLENITSNGRGHRGMPLGVIVRGMSTKGGFLLNLRYHEF